MSAPCLRRIDNLNELGRDGWDIVRLRNIDNVVPDDHKPAVHFWKRLLGGCLLVVREATFMHLDRLEALDGERGEPVLREAGDFLEKELCRPLPEGFAQAYPPRAATLPDGRPTGRKGQ